jgi:chromate transporter
MGEVSEQRTRAGVAEIFLRFLRLGCTSFGGPVAHLGYFREEFVGRLGWLEEARFAEVVGLCQFLPGPASSQVGFTIGLLEGGLAGALAAWVGFTLPSALLMVGFAYGHRLLTGRIGTGLLHGLGLAAVAVVAQAVWGMRRTLAPDWQRMLMAGVAAAMVLGWGSAAGQMVALAAGAVAGLMFCRRVAEPAGGWLVGVSRRGSVWAAGLFGVLLVGLPVLVRWGPMGGVALFAAFYRVGALVFGGGHVVLPLLQTVTVARGWVDEGTFLAGYGGAQALQGPLFSFAAYLGAVSAPLPGLGGAVVALAGIFLPGLLPAVAVLPWWEELRRRVGVRTAIAGVNASVVGVLAAALYRPVWTSAVGNVWDAGLAVAGFVALVAGGVRPWVVVGVMALAGVGLRMWMG